MRIRRAFVGLVVGVVLVGCGSADRGPAAPESPAAAAPFEATPSPAPVTPRSATTRSSAATGTPSSAEGTQSTAAGTPSSTARTPSPAAGTVGTTATPPPLAGSPSGTGTPQSGGRQRGGVACIPAVLQRHPIDLAPYDANTGRAGDAMFVRRLLFDRVLTEFGFVIPAESTSSGNAKANPQPTYLAPMGTPVYSVVDGVVDRIATLWSTPTLGDVSVMVKPDGLADGCFAVMELEHVVQPLVRVGDRVRAGQPVAQVGPLNSQGSQGLGLVELGILTGAGNGRPLHVCPYAYFAPAVREAQIGVLVQLMADWEAFAGDSSLYGEQGWRDGVVGCRSGPIAE